MKARYILYSLSVLFMLVFSACEREEFENLKENGEETAQELVSVPSKIKITPFGYEPGDTTSVKAIDYTAYEMAIKDFWLIQFGADGALLASVYHAPNAEGNLLTNHVQMDNTNENISKTKTVWIVANTGDATGLATDKLRAQLSASRAIMGSTNASDLVIFEQDGYKFTTDSESSIASLNRADGAILMSGKCSFDATDLYNTYPDGTPNYEVAKNGLEVTISSMVAKLTINYSIEGSGYTLNTIKLFRIPDRASFAKNEITRTNYKLLSYEYLIPNSGTTAYDGSITLYIPQNKRLTDEHPANSNAKSKTLNAAPKATYISFSLTKETGANVQMASVNVFPGGSKDGDKNVYNDYNICANADYTENIKITTSTIDSYLEDELTTRETRVIEKLQQNVTSNCYILNPLTSYNGGTYFNYSNLREEYYSLPVVARVNEVWYNQDGGKTILTDDTEWRMEVIWQDVPGRQIYFSESSGLKAWKNEYGPLTNQGTDAANNLSYAPYYYGRGYGENGFVNIYVKKESKDDRTEGNVLIGLRKKTGVNDKGENTYGDIIWSWHLWVTDYNPDAAGAWSSGSYKAVPGDTDDSGTRDAKVFHYKFWGSNYDWIMDRHLGALGWRPAGMFGAPDGNASNPMPDGGFESYGLYYQWGRKDPFPGKDLVTNNEFMDNTQYTNSDNVTTIDSDKSNLQQLFDITGEYQLDTDESNSVIYYRSGGTTINNYHAIPTAIGTINDTPVAPWRHLSKAWPSNNKDTKLVGEYSQIQGTKSIFDPCPPGWEVPNIDAYSGFVHSIGSSGNNNLNREFVYRFYEVETSSSEVYNGQKNIQYQVNNGAWRIDAAGGTDNTVSLHYFGTLNNAPDALDNEYTYYPCSGYYASTGRKDMQGVGDVWAADINNAASASYLYIGRGVSADWVSSGTSLYINRKGYDYGFNSAFSVRCVKKI